MQKDYSELGISSIEAMEHTAALFYSWRIRYIVNRAPMTLLCIRSIFEFAEVLEFILKLCLLLKTKVQRLLGLANPLTLCHSQQ